MEEGWAEENFLSQMAPDSEKEERKASPKEKLPSKDKSKPKERKSRKKGDKKKTGSKKPVTSDVLVLVDQEVKPTHSLKHYTNLHKLSITNCTLKKIDFVSQVKSTLTLLNLSGSKGLTDDCWAVLKGLKGLFVLNLSHCGLKSVPDSVASLTALKALVLSHNELKTLEHTNRLRELNTIVVSNNKLTALPSGLKDLPLLKKISAAHNLLTPEGLVDLTENTQLKEVRLNDNKHLDRLPEHFATWGKGSGSEKHGLITLDVGNCSINDWVSLKALSGQRGIINFVLKGNPVANEFLEDSTVEELRSKLSIILPSLRVLDGRRFDGKLKDLKEKRDSRTIEQRIVDSGPMGLAINAASAAPVEIPEELLKRKLYKERGVSSSEATRKRSRTEDEISENEGEAKKAKSVKKEKGTKKDKKEKKEKKDKGAKKEKKEKKEKEEKKESNVTQPVLSVLKGDEISATKTTVTPVESKKVTETPLAKVIEIKKNINKAGRSADAVEELLGLHKTDEPEPTHGWD